MIPRKVRWLLQRWESAAWNARSVEYGDAVADCAAELRRLYGEDVSAQTPIGFRRVPLHGPKERR